MWILLLMELFAGATVFRWLKNKNTDRNLKSWATTPTVPVLSDIMARASGGEITDRKKAIVAAVFKKSVRGYVNSDLFDSAVNGMFNQESWLHGISRRLKNRFSSEEFETEGEISEAFR